LSFSIEWQGCSWMWLHISFHSHCQGMMNLCSIKLWFLLVSLFWAIWYSISSLLICVCVCVCLLGLTFWCVLVCLGIGYF
jgi:hypothetical protein